MNHWLFLHVEPEQVRCMHWCSYDGAIWLQEEGEPNVANLLAQNAQPAQKVIMVLPAQRVLLTEVVLPAQVEADAQTLAYALEDRLTKDASELIITPLTLPSASALPAPIFDAWQQHWVKPAPGHHPVAIFDRSLLERLQHYAQSLGLTTFMLTTDALMLPLVPAQWSVWQSPQGAVARFSLLAGMGLMAGAEGFLLQHRLQECIREHRAPEAITFFGTRENAAAALEDLQAWGINLPMHYQKLNTAMLLSAPLISILPTRSGLAEQWRRWLVPWKTFPQGLLQPLRVLMMLVGLVFVIQHVQMRQEQQSLKATIDRHFNQVFTRGEEKSLNPVAQMETRVRQTHGGLTGAEQGFTPLILEVTKALKQSPSLKPLALRYEKNSLTLTFATPPAPTELARLQTQMPQVRVLANASDWVISRAAAPKSP